MIPHRIVTTGERVLGRLPHPHLEHCTDSKLETYSQPFCKRGLFAFLGVPDWGASFRFSKHLGACRYQTILEIYSNQKQGSTGIKTDM